MSAGPSNQKPVKFLFLSGPSVHLWLQLILSGSSTFVMGRSGITDFIRGHRRAATLEISQTRSVRNACLAPARPERTRDPHDSPYFRIIQSPAPQHIPTPPNASNLARIPIGAHPHARASAICSHPCSGCHCRCSAFPPVFSAKLPRTPAPSRLVSEINPNTFQRFRQFS